MSLTDNPKNAGEALIAAGGILALVGLIGIVTAMVDGGDGIGKAVSELGAIIGGIVYLMYGLKITKGNITGKVNIFGNYVRTVGVVYAITGVFFSLGLFIAGEGVSALVINIIVYLVIALIIIRISSKVLGSGDGIGTKFLWFILALIFVVLVILGIIAVISMLSPFGGIGFVQAVVKLAVYFIMALYIFDPEVKSAMGM